MLFALEPLETEPERPRRPHRAGAGALFAREPLAQEPPAPRAARRAHWLRWLFSPETLDPP